MSPDKVVTLCPVCKSRSLVEHCEGGKCRWFSCRESRCEAVIDMPRKRGHWLGPNGKRVTGSIEAA